MKKMILYTAVVLLAVACKQQGSNEATSTSTSATPAEMPYQLEKPWMNWKVGDPNNAAVAMKMVKAWQSKNVDESASFFADTSVLIFDNYRARVGQDSLKAFIKSSFADIDSIQIKMEDWESVISDDKKEEWVTLWYKQIWKDKKGVTDSMDMSDEAQVKDGKIKTFVEYGLHFPKKKSGDKKM